jgi:hypothetical protein
MVLILIWKIFHKIVHPLDYLDDEEEGDETKSTTKKKNKKKKKRMFYLSKLTKIKFIFSSREWSCDKWYASTYISSSTN